MSHPVIKNPLLEVLMPPKRIVFIVNPKAGTQVHKRIQQSVESHLNHQRFTYGIWHTERAGHAVELAKRAVEEQYDIVVAVGGDGSINEVASALMHTKVALGIVPAGSGNGLAMHLGYGRNVEAAVKKLNTAEERLIDCGLLNGRPFINLAGIGFDGLVSNLMKGQSKRGFLPYFLKSVQAGLQYEPRECTITTAERTFTEKCFVITVANGPMYGYNFQIAPDAELDDGLFSVVLLKDVARWHYFAAAATALAGNIYDAPFVEHFQASKITIHCPGDNYVHLDGEGLILRDELRFEMVPKALRILVPKGWKG